MDTLTHALSGALAARAATPAQPRPDQLTPGWRMAAGFSAAAFPDIDFALRGVDTLTYLVHHQGLTHSVVMLPVWALLLSVLFVLASRGRWRWQAFIVPVALGLAIHIVGDFFTAFGLMAFAPFSDARFSHPLLFLFDPWVTGIIVAGLILAWRARHSRLIASAALVALAGYVGVVHSLQRDAAALAHAHAARHALIEAEVSVLPQPLSPLHWKLIVRSGESWDIAHLALRRSQLARVAVRLTPLSDELATHYRLPGELEWRRVPLFGPPASEEFARAGWHSEAFAPFQRFASLPLLLEVSEELEHGRCAWFIDLRFVFPGLPPSFRYGICHSETGWQRVRQRGRFWID